jgi:hypothetical protein
MKVMDSDRNVHVDVDDTIINWEPTPLCYEVMINNKLFYANMKVIDKMERLKARGYYIIVWSAAGAQWANDVVTACGLTKTVDLCMSKPRFIIDDKPPGEWLERHGWE